MTTVPFVKMEGAGNDYVYVDAIRAAFPIERAPECARRWSDRHFGIGSDGLIVMLPGAEAPVGMAMFNADGSRGPMCGNGLRCLARLAFDHGHVKEKRFDVETDAGLRSVHLLAGDQVRTMMGEVTGGEEVEARVLGRRIRYHPVDVGSAHAVVFADDVETFDVLGIGAAMQEHAHFPGGVNVDVVAVTGPAELIQRTFERGSGETLACGTGATAAAFAARQAGRVDADEIDVRLPGGVLRVILGGAHPALEGPARVAFRGEVRMPE